MEVGTILNENLAAGEYLVKWDGSKYSSGQYFYKIESGDFVDTKKMMLLK